MSAELSFGSHFARHARYFRRECAELVDHRINRVLEREDLTAHVDFNLLRQIAVGHGRRHVSNVAHLGRKVAGHRIHRVRQVFPSTGDPLHFGLTAEFPLRTDLAGHARHFRGERAELIHHRVDRVLQLKDFSFHVDRDLLRQVAAGDGRRHRRDVAHLSREVAGHKVHGVGQVFPSTGNAFHARLAAEFAFRTDFARHARHFGCERAELVHHRVDRVFELEELAAHVDRNLLRQVAVSHGDGHFGDVADLARQVTGHRVDGISQVTPGSGDAFHGGLTAELAVGTDFAGHSRHFRGKRPELIDHAIHGPSRAQEFPFERPPFEVEGHRLRKISFRYGTDDAGHFARRMHEIADQRIDRLDRTTPSAAQAALRGTLADFPFLTDDATDAIHLVGHAFKLIHHVVKSIADFAAEAGPGRRQPYGEVTPS